MNGRSLRVVIVGLLMGIVASPQSNQRKFAFHPDLKQCEALASAVGDPLTVRQLTASHLNELDWELSVCVGDFGPMQPKGALLLLSAHGNVADELRLRLERAVGTLPVQEQAKVWAAFNADRGTLAH
jgi:hypothetical protein